MGGDVFQEGDAPWVGFWMDQVAQIDGPVVAEIRADVKTIYNINIQSSTFGGKVLLYVRVPTSQLGYDGGLQRIPQSKQPSYVETGKVKVLEWMPWIEFGSGELRFLWKWVRESTNYEVPALVFAIEAHGTFPLGSRGGFFPFDFHELTFKVTSNWDSEKLVFVPWDDKKVWTPEIATRLLEEEVPVLDVNVSRIRQDEMRESLKNTWDYSRTPRLVFTSNEGFTGKKYSEVQVQVLVTRYAFIHIAYEMLRPIALALLAPLAINFFDDEATRLGFVSSILIAMSLAFLRGSSERVTFADYYKLAMFVFTAVVLVFSSFTSLIPDLAKIDIVGASWALFVVLHGCFVLAYLYQLKLTRNARLRHRRNVKTRLRAIREKLHDEDLSNYPQDTGGVYEYNSDRKIAPGIP